MENKKYKELKQAIYDLAELELINKEEVDNMISGLNSIFE